jgi:peptide/nickel transport system substrate-binding protein
MRMLMTLVVLTLTMWTGAAQAALDELVVATGADVVALHPADASDSDTESVLRNIVEPLLYRDHQMRLEPRLAERWEQVDPVSWKFYLRRNVKFHNGTPFTADDVVATIREMMSPADGRPYRQGLYISPLESISKVDDFTVIIKTKTPFGPFLRYMAELPIAPKGATRAELNAKPIGTGPYRFIEWVKGDHTTLEANPAYWGERPAIRRVIFRVIPEAQARLAYAQTGRAQIVLRVLPQQVDTAKAVKNYRVIPADNVYIMHLGFNMFKPPMDNLHLRQAISHAIDRDKLIKFVLQGYAAPLNGPLDPKTFGYQADLQQPAYNPAKARELLVKAGYPNGVTLDFDTPSGRYLNDKQVSEAIAGMLSDVGIKVNLRVQEWSNYMQTIPKKQQSHLWFIGFGDYTFDADRSMACYNKSYVFGSTNITKLDELWQKGRSVADPQARLAIYREMLNEWKETAPNVILYRQGVIHVVHDRVEFSPRLDDRMILTEIKARN